MPIRSRAAAAAVHILTALCAAVGVVLQCGFFGGRLNLAALQYFTLMSNILCAVYFAGAAVRTLRRGGPSSCGWASLSPSAASATACRSSSS